MKKKTSKTSDLNLANNNNTTTLMMVIVIWKARESVTGLNQQLLLLLLLLLKIFAVMKSVAEHTQKLKATLHKSVDVVPTERIKPPPWPLLPLRRSHWVVIVGTVNQQYFGSHIMLLHWSSNMEFFPLRFFPLPSSVIHSLIHSFCSPNLLTFQLVFGFVVIGNPADLLCFITWFFVFAGLLSSKCNRISH